MCINYEALAGWLVGRLIIQILGVARPQHKIRALDVFIFPRVCWLTATAESSDGAHRDFSPRRTSPLRRECSAFEKKQRIDFSPARARESECSFLSLMSSCQPKLRCLSIGKSTRPAILPASARGHSGEIGKLQQFLTQHL
jgi:hypothetical protein